MTVIAMLTAARKAWALVLVGAACTVLACTFVARSTGVYWAQVDVVFLGPISETRPNPLGYSSQRLVDVASVVQRDVTGTTDQTQVVSSDVYLIDTGVRKGSWVRLPNSGGQWIISYDRPVLDVQVVDASPAAVLARMQGLLGEISADLNRRQEAAGVDESHRVTTSVSPPPDVEVHYSAGPVKRALLVTLLTLGGLTLAAADWWDRRFGATRRQGIRWTSRKVSLGARVGAAR
jgi:hypothetical protein